MVNCTLHAAEYQTSSTRPPPNRRGSTYRSSIRLLKSMSETESFADQIIPGQLREILCFLGGVLWDERLYFNGQSNGIDVVLLGQRNLEASKMSFHKILHDSESKLTWNA